MGAALPQMEKYEDHMPVILQRAHEILKLARVATWAERVAKSHEMESQIERGIPLHPFGDCASWLPGLSALWKWGWSQAFSLKCADLDIAKSKRGYEMTFD